MTNEADRRCPFCFGSVDEAEWCSDECRVAMQEYETSDGAKYSEVSHVG